MGVSGLLLDWRQVTGKGDSAAGSCELRPRSPSGRGRSQPRSPSSSVLHGRHVHFPQHRRSHPPPLSMARRPPRMSGKDLVLRHTSPGSGGGERAGGRGGPSCGLTLRAHSWGKRLTFLLILISLHAQNERWGWIEPAPPPQPVMVREQACPSEEGWRDLVSSS